MKKWIVVVMGLGVFGALTMPSTALADDTKTVHISTQVVPLTAPPDLPASCPVQLPVVIVSNNGNGVVHLNVNNNGDWFTSTYEGDATLSQLLGFSGRRAIAGPPLFQGHLETWFGSEDNKQNSVIHTTLNYHGTSLTDPSLSISIHGFFGLTTNANGDVTANPISLDCH